MKKTAAALIIALLVIAAAGAQFVNFSKANPYFDGGIVLPDSSAKPPRISIFAPQNNTVYTTNTIPLSINVSSPESQKAATVLDLVYYEADWQENRTYLFPIGTFPTYLQHAQNLTTIPDGNHTLRVFAHGWGSYIENWYRYSFPLSASSSINFTIDTVPPKVVLSMEKGIYYATDIQLNFALDETDTQIAYSLDGNENVTVAGNTTLMNLSYGEHNATAYVTDEAGNTGTSETIHFTIEPFPTVPVSAAFAASVALVGTSLLLFLRKRRRQALSVS
jgi:hypothetical protein